MAKLSGCRILVVDDEALIALDIAAALENEGAVVVGPANNVAEAKRLLAETIHCAILDVSLGKESVSPLVRELQASGVPLVFVTGYDEHDLPAVWRVWPILPKPIVTTYLVDTAARM